MRKDKNGNKIKKHASKKWEELSSQNKILTNVKH